MLTINLDSTSGLKSGQLSVFPSKTQITGFINIRTNGTVWYLFADWRYGNVSDYPNEANVKFDNLPFGIDVEMIAINGVELYPTTDGGFNDFRKDIHRVCDRFKQALENQVPSLIGQITVTGI
tara:strand:+ start:1522 stop:1890 length:369 start_codon:yes stop_codon:yes gene_type:complete